MKPGDLVRIKGKPRSWQHPELVGVVGVVVEVLPVHRNREPDYQHWTVMMGGKLVHIWVKNLEVIDETG
jgi:hypothetical protein